MAQVGWFGGSFDPVHRAHVALACAALDQLALDEVRWVVAGQPWQKSGRRMASAEDRVAMVRLAIEDEGGRAPGSARFVLDEREIRRAGPSYTLDSVREYQQERPGDTLWLILGQDQLAGFTSWHGWEELVERVGLAVAARARDEVRAPAALLERPHRLVRLAMPALTWSSTEARQRAAEGADVGPVVGDKVAGYIARHRLYSES